jgi:hypothetical protein
MRGPLTRQELTALAREELTVDLVTAGRAWNLGRTKVHELARGDALPFPVFRLGTSYRVPVDGLLRSLGMCTSGLVEGAPGVNEAGAHAPVAPS